MELLNKEMIQRLANDIGQENVPMLLEIFLGELTDYISMLSKDDPEFVSHQLEEISHALKSSAASFGADKLCALAHEVDKQAKLGESIYEYRLAFIELLQQTQQNYLQWLEK